MGIQWNSFGVHFRNCYKGTKEKKKEKRKIRNVLRKVRKRKRFLKHKLFYVGILKRASSLANTASRYYSLTLIYNRDEKGEK